MQEDKQYADGTYILHQEQINMEHRSIAQSTPVGELILHNFMRNKPTDEYTGEETHDGQEQLARYKVEEVEECLAEELQHLAHA